MRHYFKILKWKSRSVRHGISMLPVFLKFYYAFVCFLRGTCNNTIICRYTFWQFIYGQWRKQHHKDVEIIFLGLVFFNQFHAHVLLSFKSFRHSAPVSAWCQRNLIQMGAFGLKWINLFRPRGWGRSIPHFYIISS